MTLLRFAGVGKQFGDRWVVRGVDFHVSPGDRWGIVGRNGVGKTTVPLARYEKVPERRIEAAAPPRPEYENSTGICTVSVVRAPTENSRSYVPSAKSIHSSPEASASRTASW